MFHDLCLALRSPIIKVGRVWLVKELRDSGERVLEGGLYAEDIMIGEGRFSLMDMDSNGGWVEDWVREWGMEDLRSMATPPPR